MHMCPRIPDSCFCRDWHGQSLCNSLQQAKHFSHEIPVLCLFCVTAECWQVMTLADLCELGWYLWYRKLCMPLVTIWTNVRSDHGSVLPMSSPKDSTSSLTSTLLTQSPHGVNATQSQGSRKCIGLFPQTKRCTSRRRMPAQPAKQEIKLLTSC